MSTSTHRILINRAQLLSNPNTRIVSIAANPQGDELGTFRLDPNMIVYNYVHQKKSRFFCHNVSSIPLELLDLLAANNIPYKIEVIAQTPAPADLVDPCNANSDLADSNLDLRAELEEARNHITRWQKKYWDAANEHTDLRNKVLALAKELESI